MARWTPLAKWWVVTGVRDGSLALDDVLRVHGLSSEEYAGWSRQYEAHGAAGLRTTKLQSYRAAKRR